MMKEITVVMPVYKVEKYVSECLDSIINQTFDCFECIIIDDCSPDNSMRLIEEKLAGYKGNISFRIVRNERNEGVSAARNKHIRNRRTAQDYRRIPPYAIGRMYDHRGKYQPSSKSSG